MKTVYFIMLSVFLIAQATVLSNTITPVPWTDVDFEDGFWQDRQQSVATGTVPTVLEHCENFFLNFAKAAGLREGQFIGQPWDDSVAFTAINSAACLLAWHNDPELETQIDTYISWIAAAQEPDGYLYSARKLWTTEQLKGGYGWAYDRWVNMVSSHEGFNAYHLMDAGIAYYEATGKRNLLDVAIKNADLWANEFKPGKADYLTGHEGVKLGLLRLFHLTGNRKYFECAKYLMDIRGVPGTRAQNSPSVQAHKPVRDQHTAVGHQVRAHYLYAAMAEVASETGDRLLINALNALWDDVIGKKIYITGGSSGTGEAYQGDYILPNKEAYCESCAGISSIFWNHKMHLLFEDAKYIDVLERTLYNNTLSAVSLDGKLFHYKNPLQVDATTKYNHGHLRRGSWQSVACCPPNLGRLLGSIGGYFYTANDESLYVNLYGSNTTTTHIGEKQLTIRQSTGYPWDGKISLTLSPENRSAFSVFLRIPGWVLGKPLPSDLYEYEDSAAAYWRVWINGKEQNNLVIQKGYIVLERTWEDGDLIELDFPMQVRKVRAHEKVRANKGLIAFERGPIVFCAEGVDNPEKFDHIIIDSETMFEQFQPKLLEGVMTLVGTGTVPLRTRSGVPLQVEVVLVPYYAWANRDIGPMTVWLPYHTE